MGRPATVGSMSTTDFRDVAYTVCRTLDELAPLLDRSKTTLSSYMTGRLAIPDDVAERLKQLCREKIERLQSQTSLDPTINAAQAYKNTQLLAQLRAADEAAAKMGWNRRHFLANRRSRATPRPYPAYRMTHEKVRVLAEAFKRYLGFIRGERQSCRDTQRMQDLDMELADISRLARQTVEVYQGPPPYDFYITNLEWYVVSRALRYLEAHHGVVQARSLYQHWRKYKGLHFVSHGKYSYRGATDKPTTIIDPMAVVRSSQHGQIDIERTIADLFGSDGQEQTDPGRHPAVSEDLCTADGDWAVSGGVAELDQTNSGSEPRDERTSDDRGGVSGSSQQHGGVVGSGNCPSCGAAAEHTCQPECALG